MAEFKKLSKEEVEKLDKKDIVLAEKAGEGEVEAQGGFKIRCPKCGTVGTCSKVGYFYCMTCFSTFHFCPL